MKYVVLVAIREYMENAKTKGFWFGLLMFPLIIGVAAVVPTLLEQKAIPTRHFVLVDQSGLFEELIMDRLEREHQQQVLEALNEYAREYAGSASAPQDGGSVSSARDSSGSDADSVPAQPALTGGANLSLDQFLEQGGKTGYLKRLEPYLSDDAPPFEEPRRRYQRVDLPASLSSGAELNRLAQQLKPYLVDQEKIEIKGRSHHLFAAILIPDLPGSDGTSPGEGADAASSGAGLEVQYWSRNLADMSLAQKVEQTVNQEVRRRAFIARGMNPATVNEVERKRVTFAKLNPKKEEGREEVGQADYLRQWAPTAFVYLLWVALMTISQMLLNNTIEEKSNRIIEVLLSSVTAGELMLGKLVGIGAVGLTMVGVWVMALIGVVTSQSGPQSEMIGQAAEILQTSRLIPAFIVYFFFGYIMYAGIFLSIGSLCNTLKEAQNLFAVVMVIMLVPLLTMFYIPKDPHGTLAVILSWIPIFTPFAMMNRVTADPPLFEVIGTMVVLLGSVALVLWLSGRIFRIGILRTGQPPKLRELIRWLKG